MKKTVLYLIVTALLLGVLLGGCQNKTDADGTDPSTSGGEGPVDNKPDESKPDESKPVESGSTDSKPTESEPEDVDPNALTAEELSVWAERFEPDWYNEEKDEWELNPLNGFFMAFWSDPSEIDLGFFIYYFPGEIITDGYNEPPYDEELTDLAAFHGQSVEEFQDELMVPATRVRASEVNDVLTKYAGVTWDQITNDGVHYFEKYDAFYSYSSDMPRGFDPILEGRRDGNLIMLTADVVVIDENGLYGEDYDYFGEAVLTIRVDGEDWQLLSFMPK